MHSFMKPLAVCFLLSQIALPFSVLGQQSQAAAPEPVVRTAEPKSSEKTAKDPAATYQEDFAALPVDKNRLTAEIPVLGERDDTPGKPFIRERWQVMWRPGDPLDLYVVKPRGVEKPPVVLYLYSFPQDTERFKQDYWCGQTTGMGFAAVGFVSAVTGHRLEYRSLKDDFFNQLPEALGATVHDVQMILNYLASRNDLDMSRVGIFGQGSGGSIAILASAVDPRIKALDVLTPWGDWPIFLAQSTIVPQEDRQQVNKPEFLKKVAGLDPLQWFPKVKAQSVRIQNIRRDGHTPDAAQELMEAAAPETAEIDQFGDTAALVPMAGNGRLLEWLTAQLRPDAKPQVALDKSQRTHVFPARMPADPLGTTP